MDAKSINITTHQYSDNCKLYRNLPPGSIDLDTLEIAAVAFSAKRNNKELSTDWNKFSNSEDCLVRVGLTFKTGKTEYKDQNKFRLCMLTVGEIRKIEAIDDIKFTPIHNDPEIIGSPNNPSHTDVCYEDEEIRLKMKGIAKLVEGLDYSAIENRVLELRQLP